MKIILLRYGELTLKLKNRKHFERKLHENVQKQLADFKLVVKKDRNRIYLVEIEQSQIPAIEEVIKRIPGIHSYAIATSCEPTVDAIKKLAFEVFDPNIQNFRVTVKRINKNFPMISNQFEREVGAHILINTDDERELKVNLQNFEQEIKIEIHHHLAFVFNKHIPAMGGLPIGTAGHALVFLSGGIDSPVAAIQAMKRGLRVTLMHFSSPPYTLDESLEKVKDLTKVLQKYDSSIKLYDMKVTDLQVAINNHCHASDQVLLLRRMMIRIAKRLMKKTKTNAIVTGENLAQVASQILPSMQITDNTCDVLILRPLLTYDKIEIIELAKEYGTYDISIRPFDDCCVIFVPKKPNLNPKLDMILKEETKINYEELITEMKYDVYTKEMLNEEKENLLTEFF
ncbi:MAG: tRNA uracil 4-sulfurtransferase ThiI [Mycoplasmatales bacterium]